MWRNPARQLRHATPVTPQFREKAAARALDVLRARSARRHKKHIALMAFTGGAVAVAAMMLFYTERQRVPQATLLEAPLKPIVPVVIVTQQQARQVQQGAHRFNVFAHTQLRSQRLSEGQQRWRLSEGKAEFIIHPLAQGEQFSVETPQLRLEVVGTRFTIDSDSLCTQVSVAHGKVMVRPHAGAARALTAGQDWTLCGDISSQQALSEQLQLLRRAYTAIRAGQDLHLAKQLLTQYLQQSPDGTFSADARRHLSQIQQTIRHLRERPVP